MAGLTVNVPIRLSDKAQKDLYETCMAYKELAETRGAENAKLRELVDYMTPIALYGASERERDRMRELGVEE